MVAFDPKRTLELPAHRARLPAQDMNDLSDEKITTWDAASDYLIGGASGLGAFFLGLSRGMAILIAMASFVAVALGKRIYQRWRGTGDV